MHEVQDFFKGRYGRPPAFVVQAPGRLELLGNHTDYNQGLVMALAINRFILLASAPRKDGRIELASSAFPQRETFLADHIEKSSAAPWTDYVKGVLAQLARRKVHFGGFSAAVHSSIPLGAGMSSSAALEVATALTLRQLFPYRLTATGQAPPPERDKDGLVSEPLGREERLELAKLCQAAENEFVGMKCGILDQISSLFGKAHHAIQIDCRSLTVEQIPMIGQFAVVVCNSGVKHALVDGEYNERRRQCEAAAQALGVSSLRQVDPKTLAANKHKLEERPYQCAYHIVGENQRVIFGERALREGDLEQFGQYLYQSHESSRDFFRNSCPELDLLVELARAHQGCYGARLTGGGFGGATLNLVDLLQVEDFCHTIAAQYTERTGHPLQPVLCQIVDGAA